MRRWFLGSVAIVAICGVAPLAVHAHRRGASYPASEVERLMFATMGNTPHPHPYWPVSVSCARLMAGDGFLCVMTYREMATGRVNVFPFVAKCEADYCFRRF